MINLFLLAILVNVLIFLNFNKISKNYNIYDIPDSVRKKHKISTPLVGGLILYINILFVMILHNLNFFENSFFGSNREMLIFLISLSSLFILGFVDDKYNLGANFKLIAISFVVFLAISFDNDLIIREISLTFYNQKIALQSFSIPVTMLCFLLFINAFNMLDGINGQAISYAIFIIVIFVFYKINSYFSCFVMVALLFCLFLNLKSRMFLGDSGTLFLSYMIGYFFIKQYNLKSVLRSDEIFLIMMIPGFELLRLALYRAIKKKHPFKADRNHIHHLILRKNNFFFTYVFVQCLLFFPFLLNLILNNTPLVVCVSALLYASIIYFYSRLKNYEDKFDE